MNRETTEEKVGGESRFAATDEEAKARFKKYKSLDPFPKIQPALLNSADISDYVSKTAMIYPFDENKLKSASYAVSILGRVIYWNENGEKCSCVLKKDDIFILPMNSIAFVTPEPIFRLPDYLAIRFNLKITHVHRGVLLGTGPLVDPGFEGNLLIPLHNLTNNQYSFKGGEDLIWVEFTKISQNKRWYNKYKNSEDQVGNYYPFPDQKLNMLPETYIEKALEGQNCSSIRSSIPLSIQETSESAHKSSISASEAEKASKQAKADMESLEKRFYKYSFIGILGLVVALVALTVTVYQTIQDSNSYVTEAWIHFKDSKAAIENKITSLEDLVNKQSGCIEDLKIEIQALKQAQENSQKKALNIPKK